MVVNKNSVHLANVLAIAEADGAMTAPEAAALSEIMQRMSATEADLAAARELMKREHPYRLQSLQHSSDAIRMIDDMVFISFADGQILPPESKPLEAFLSEHGFVQADMDMIVQRVRARLGKLSVASVSEATPKKRSPVIDTSGHTMDAARNPVEKRIRAQASTSTLPPAPVCPVEQAAPRGDLERESGGARPEDAAVEPVVQRPEETPLQACMRQRESTSLGACYCLGVSDDALNPWGCRLLHMAWSAASDWFALGHFRDGETFVFDRQAIAAQLHERLADVQACPFLIKQFAEQALSVLPTRATTSGRWQHHFVAQGMPSATAVVVRSYRHGCVREVKAWADRFEPTDDQDAQRMIRRVARMMGITLDFKQLDRNKEATHE